MSETNLQRLDRMFPGTLLLSPAQTAEALGWNRKKVYRLIEAETFPIKPRNVGALIGIPKIALAKWLDGDEGEGMEKAPPPAQKAPETPKRGRGRPRGSSRQRKAAMVVVASFKQRLAAVLDAGPSVRDAFDALKAAAEAATARGV